ncbi:MAG: SpoIIE family protein phosphatase [Candidatus Krumholzibacteriota bacterium]|nr:SpoIIE family protein phosphatase [Candidatus Krumholzibacteriota bacterium]
MNGLLRAGAVAGALFIALLAVPGAREIPRAPYTGIYHRNLIIQEIAPDSPNAGLDLQRGDRILAVGGVVPRNLNHFRRLESTGRIGETRTWTIARGDSIFDAPVAGAAAGPDRIARKTAFFILGMIFVVAGIIVFLRRPDVLGVLFLVNCSLFAFIMTERPSTGVPFLHIAGELIYDFSIIFLPATFLHFFLRFPGTEIRRGTRRSIAVRVLYLPPAVLFVSTFVMALYRYTFGMHAGNDTVLIAATALSWPVYILWSMAAFTRTWRASPAGQRLKFRIAFAGLLLGIVPFIVVMLLRQFAPGIAMSHAHLSVLFFSFVIVSFAYAILKHDAFNMTSFFRRSLSGLILAGLLVTGWILLVQIPGESFARLGLGRSVVAVAAVVLLSMAVIPARRLVQRLVDRAFLRGRKIFRAEVVSFTRRIQCMMNVDEIASFATAEMRNLFRPDAVHLYLRDAQGRYTHAQSEPASVRPPLTSLPSEAAIVRMATEDGQPVMIEYFDHLWLTNRLDRASRELLSISAASVVVPLREHGELLGFFLLGRKGSGAPYTGEEAEVLELVGERSAAALKSIQLYGDSLEKDRLQEELQLARDIQERLLPGRPPEMKSAELRAGLRTSKEMGGDFYDWLELGPGRVGIAVADVSGKGIPATILMTTLQASFRAEAVRGRGPAEVLASLNASLYRRSDPAKFATFFYGVYDEERGTLHYSNGGSFPPVIVGADGRLERLHRGGILIGVDEESTYREGMVKLRPGDVLVIYTDGFIDQENEHGEPFGEQNLIQYFRDNARLSIDELMDKLFATLLAFGHNIVKDDMTVLLLRRKAPVADRGTVYSANPIPE